MARIGCNRNYIRDFFGMGTYACLPRLERPDEHAQVVNRGMGDLYSESEARGILDAANAAATSAQAAYNKAYPELVKTQVDTLYKKSLPAMRQALGRAEAQFTAELEKPFYVNSDYDLAVKNARQAETYAKNIIADIAAFLRYNRDERERLKDMEAQRQLALKQAVSDEEVKAAQGGLVAYAGFKAKEAGEELGETTKQIAEGMMGALTGFLKGIPWWMWVLGLGVAGAYIAGPALATRALARRA